MAGSSSAGRALGRGLGGEAAPAWPAAWPKPSIHESRNRCHLETALSSFLRRVTAGLGAGISLWKRLLFLPGSAECLYTLGAEQPVPGESLQPTAACVSDVPGLQQAQTLLGRGWEVAATVEVALAWKLLSCPVPGSLRVLFSLCRLRFLLCRAYVLVNTGRIIFFVI